jgi:hypothetical protein
MSEQTRTLGRSVAEIRRKALVTLGWTELGAEGRTAKEWEDDARELAEIVVELGADDRDVACPSCNAIFPVPVAQRAPLGEAIARAIESARQTRDAAKPQDKRELALVVTKLEEAALWLGEYRAKEHQGADAILNWLRESA